MNPSKMTIPQRVAAIVRRFPALALLAAIVLCVAIAPGVTRLRSDFTHHGYFYPSDPALIDLERMEQRFGNDDTVVVAVHSPSGIFDRESSALVRELTRKLWQVPDVVRVDSISNFRWVHSQNDELVVEPMLPDDAEPSDAFLAERRAVAIAHESLPGYLISKDARSALVFARLRPALGHPPDAKKIVAAVEEIVQGLQRGDHVFHVTGGPAIEAAYAAAADKDTARMMPLVLAACLVILSLLLRNVAAVAACMVVALVGSFASLCIAGWLGVEFTSVTAALPVIFIAIGITDPIRILSAFLLERARGVERDVAAESAMSKNFLPTIATSLTTAVGFLSYLTANIKTVAGFGLVAGCACVFAWVFGHLFVGGLLYLLPWKRVAKRSEFSIDRLAIPLTDWVFRSRKLIIAGFAVIGVAAVAVTATIEVDADPVQYFAPGHPLREATDFIERGVGAARGVEIVVDTHSVDGIKSPEFLRRVEKLEQWLRARPHITQTISILDVLKHTNRALNDDDPKAYQLPSDARGVAQELLLYSLNLPEGMGLNDRVTIDNSALRITTLWTIGSSNEALAEIAEIEREAKSLGLDASVTGKYPLFQRLEYHLVRSFLSSFGTELAVVAIVLTLFFRSGWLGMLAIVPNLLPLVAGGGVLWLLGEKLTVGTVLVASLCLGIALDDTTHVFADFLRLRNEGHDSRSAIREFFRDKALAVASTSTVLVATFGAFCLSTFTPNRVFGVMTAIILMLGLIADLTLSPALLASIRFKKAEALPASANGETDAEVLPAE